MNRRPALLAVLVLALGVRSGAAWEPATTHAGLTEQAALASSLHDRLKNQFGYERGLFADLTIPPADAPDLFQVMRRLNPTHGYVPDGRGRLHALGWLVAGSAIADIPAAFAGNHFYDPLTRSGLTDRTLGGALSDLRLHLVAAMTGQHLHETGMAAPDWVVSRKNPLGLAGFQDQYVKAVSAKTPGERERHLAGALVAAGAMVHVLEDMGSPSHARDDLAAHLDQLGQSPADRGSRFERIAALAYGRLGVPPPAKVVDDRPLRAFFTAKDGTGLADLTSRSWFSADTLPGPIDLGGDPRGALRAHMAGSLKRPSPAPPASLDLGAAAGERGATLENSRGVCLARYQVRAHRLSWFTDDDCELAQVTAILPTVGGYAAGMINTLFRGSLSLEGEGGRIAVRVGATALGAGRVTLFWDDERGVRTRYSQITIKRGAAGHIAAAGAEPPQGARRVTALFEGTDSTGRPLLATGTASYPILPR